MNNDGVEVNKVISKYPQKKKNRLFLVGFLVGGLLVIIISLCVYGKGLYHYMWQDKYAKAITFVTPFPAMSINGDFVRYSTFLEDFESVQYFIRKQNTLAGNTVDPSREELIKILSDQYIQVALLEAESRKYNVSVGQSDIDEEFQNLVALNTSEEEVKNSIKDLYNWDIDTFKEKVLRIALLERKVSEEIAKDQTIDENKVAYDKITKIKERIDGGEDFTEIAKSESEDEYTKDGGGALGTFPEGAMVKAFDEAAFSLGDGEVSDIITTAFGYHIIKVDAHGTDDEGKKTATASHILIRSINISDYFNTLREKADIDYYINVEDIPGIINYDYSNDEN